MARQQPTGQELDEQTDLLMQLQKKVGKLVDRYKTVCVAGKKGNRSAVGLYALFSLLESELVDMVDNANYNEQYIDKIKLLVRIKDYGLIAALDYMAKHKTDIFNSEFGDESNAYLRKAYDELDKRFQKTDPYYHHD